MSTPTTFEAHGHLWHLWQVHTPGDPMPCDGNAKIAFILRGDVNQRFQNEANSASRLNWGSKPFGSSNAEVIGWRFANPAQEKDELTRLREENASMRTAIKAGHTALEKALLVHKTITTYSKQSAEDLAANMEHCGILAEALATLSPFTESK